MNAQSLKRPSLQESRPRLHIPAILCLLGLLIATFSGCFGPDTRPYMMQPIPIPGSEAEPVLEDERVRHVMQPGSQPIQEGNLLRYLTLDGKRRFMRVSEIGSDYVAGKTSSLTTRNIFMSAEKPIRFQDIVFLERKVRKSSNIYSRFPILLPEQAEDAHLSCEALEAEILRVDVLRRAINKELDLMGWQEVNVVLSFGLEGIPRDPKEWNVKAYSAAHDRLVHLMQLWLDRDCGHLPGKYDRRSIERFFVEEEQLQKARKARKLSEELFRRDIRSALNKALRRN